jgi:hypothetical protein
VDSSAFRVTRQRRSSHNPAVLALLAVLVLGSVLAASASAGAGAAGPGEACRWHVVSDLQGPDLWAAAALADNDVWAVGDNGVRGTILHWNGRRWRSVASPVFAFDIDAVSAHDVWAVGSSLPGGLRTRPRAEHWNGTRWRTVPVPGRSGEFLRAVAALSPRDVWVVGEKERGPLVEHWNGFAWEPIPNGPRDGLLHGIDALSPLAIWAVGTQGMMTLGPASEDALIERLQGGRWRTVPAPRVAWLNDNLLAVDAVSPDEAWAVGSVDVPGRAPLVERWDGRAWSVASMSGLPAEASLRGVAAFGPGDVWAAGSRGFGQAERALLAHWDGRHWSQVPGPRGSLADLAALSPRDIWAVGGSLGGGQRSRSLIEHYSCGPA